MEARGFAIALGGRDGIAIRLAIRLAIHVLPPMIGVIWRALVEVGRLSSEGDCFCSGHAASECRADVRANGALSQFVRCYDIEKQ